jgi:hypothetical protein
MVKMKRRKSLSDLRHGDGEAMDFMEAKNLLRMV